MARRVSSNDLDQWKRTAVNWEFSGPEPSLYDRDVLSLHDDELQDLAWTESHFSIDSVEHGWPPVLLLPGVWNLSAAVDAAHFHDIRCQRSPLAFPVLAYGSGFGLSWSDENPRPLRWRAFNAAREMIEESDRNARAEQGHRELG